MKSYQKIICAILSLLAVIILLTFKSIPSGQLWKNYTVLYVPVETSDSDVLAAMEHAQIKEVVMLGGQYLPVLFSANSPEMSMYKLNRDEAAYSYAVNRNAYFFDKSNQFKLFYIPVQYKSNLNKCISELESIKISSGVDSSSAYPWILPLICTILAVVLIYFSKNKMIFACGVFLPVIFVYCNPFYPIGLSNILVQLVLFFATNIWNRKNALKTLTSNYIVLGMITIALITPFACTVLSGFLFIFCIVGALSFIICYENIRIFFERKQNFKMVYIRSARMVSIFANKQKVVMPSVTVCAFLILLVFALTSSDTINAHFSKVQLPAANGVTSENLPDLNDYYAWVWNIKAYPYKSLNVNEDNPDSIEFRRFTDNNGSIEQHVNFMNYNEEFITEVYNNIDELPFESIEKVLKMQKGDLHPGYASTNSYHIGIFGIIMMLFSLGVLLFIYISIIIKKGARK